MIASAVNRVASQAVSRGLLVALLVALVLFPLVVGDAGRYFTVLMMTVFIFATLGHAWNLLAGFCGLLSFGIQVYVGLGGFSVAILSYYFAVPVWWAVLLSTVTTAAFALLLAAPLSGRHARRDTWIGVIVAIALWIAYEVVIGFHPGADIFGSAYIRRVILLFLLFVGALPLLKLQGAYFAVATWLIAAAVASIFNEWRVVGAGGGMNIASDTTIAERYYAGLVLVVVATGAVWWLLNSRYGQALTAVRDDEEAAMAVGIDIRLVKTMAFLISAPLAGLAAALYYVDAVTITPPDAFSIRWSAYAVFIVVAGGMGTLVGPIIGAVILVIVQRFLVGLWGGGDLTLGIAAVLLILILPRGVAGLLADLRAWAARGEGLRGTGATIVPAPDRQPGGVAFAGLLPSRPLPHLVPDPPAWSGLRDGYVTLARRVRDSGFDALVIFSTAPASATTRRASQTVGARNSDPAYPAIGAIGDISDIGYELTLDLPLTEALSRAGLRCLLPGAENRFGDAGAAATLAEIGLARDVPVVVVDVSGLTGPAAARAGEAVRDAARDTGRRIAVLGLTGLSGSALPPDFESDPALIASLEHDRANRQILGWLQSGDEAALETATPAFLAGSGIEGSGAVLAALVGVARGRGRWRAAEILSYGAIFGAGAAVADLRIEAGPGGRR